MRQKSLRPSDARRGLSSNRRWIAAQPMWRRVPTRCEDGRRTADFMMLIPTLRSQSGQRLEETLARIHGVLSSYGQAVVFADVNLRLRLLWVSVRSAPGICLELASAVQALVPEAKLIANRAELLRRERTRQRPWRRPG